MKKQIAVIIAVACLYACKTRQVSIDKTSVADKSIKTELIKDTSLHIDTGKTITHTLAKQSSKDSVEIEITPDTGVVQITNGNYIGKARNIIIKSSSALLQSTDNLVQQSKGEITRSTLMDSIIQKNNIQTQIKTKEIAAQGINSLWYWLVGILALAAVGLAKLKHWY